MQPVPSDRPRPPGLRIRHRPWWKRFTFRFLFLVFAMFVAFIFWLIVRLAYFSDEPPREGRPASPQPAGTSRSDGRLKKNGLNSDFAHTQRLWAA